MDTRALAHSHRPATPSDIPLLCAMANADPRTVWIRDLPNEPFALSEIAHGPFSWTIEDGRPVLSGIDSATNHFVKLRLQGETVELINDHFTAWTPPSWGGVRIYVPR